MVGAPPLLKVGEGRGIQERSFWAELDIWALNLGQIFVSCETDGALPGDLPTYQVRAQSSESNERTGPPRFLKNLYNMGEEGESCRFEKGLLVASDAVS